MTLWKEIKNQFRKPTPLEVATAELVEAELEKLVDETAREHAEASVSYNNARITRLRKYIANLTKEEVK
jgi:hypothetical protein